jgi:hypothetical protein
MTRSNRSILHTAQMVLMCLVLGACASSIERPVASLSRAEASVDHAEQNGGPQYGAAALERARDKLSAAQQAADKDRNAEALRLANEAELDARLATAQAERYKAEASLREINESISTLQQETSSVNAH